MNVFIETTLGITNWHIFMLPIFISILLFIFYILSWIYSWIFDWIDDQPGKTKINKLTLFLANLHGYDHISNYTTHNDRFYVAGNAGGPFAKKETIEIRKYANRPSAAIACEESDFYMSIVQVSLVIALSIVFWQLASIIYLTVGIAYLARGLRRLQKKFKEHIKDPAAHNHEQS